MARFLYKNVINHLLLVPFANHRTNGGIRSASRLFPKLLNFFKKNEPPSHSHLKPEELNTELCYYINYIIMYLHIKPLQANDFNEMSETIQTCTSLLPRAHQQRPLSYGYYIHVATLRYGHVNKPTHSTHGELNV